MSDWVVALQDMGLHCKRCGETYSPRLPIPVYLWIALQEAFLDVHQECEEPADE